MAEKVVRVCDLDECEELAETYTVGKAGDVREVDLCANHGAPVRALLEMLKGSGEVKVPTKPPRVRKAPSRTPNSAPRRSRIKVTDMSEVQGLTFKAP